MNEKIGKVVLDYRCYSGKDLYSDGDIEDKLLELVKHYKKSEFNQVISRTQDWTVMYHLSHIRSNILGSVQINKTDDVLEIGSGCGAITGALAKKANKVTCIELSKKRSLINAFQNQDYDNIQIKVGNFQDIESYLKEKFDVITLIGVFEYAQLYIQSQYPFVDFLKKILEHLKPDGRIILAIENKFGMKYWAGCQEDHIGGYFSGLEGYRDKEKKVMTFSKKELEKIFRDVGFEKYDFYYPYPDYKFPMAIYSDDFLPREGELNRNLQNFDRQRMVLFNETNVYDEILKDGMFPFFSNSFLVVLYKGRE